MALNVNIFSFFHTMLFFLVLHVSVLSFTKSHNTNVGFSVDLIHRDSPLSPFYNPSATHFDRLKNAVHRSHSRVRHLRPGPGASSGPIQAQIQSSSGEYLMKVSIGTPPIETLGIADTGSDLTWIQCRPCTKCFKQNAPFFNLKASSTYKTLKCYSKQCKTLEEYNSCSRKHNKCQYHVSYGDHSYSNGHLATETFTFGGKTPIEKVVFGCGHNNGGIFSDTSMGIIGLGGGPLSIITQLSESIKGRFSYCLVPIYKGSNVTSTINFGAKALISGSSVVSTPLFLGPVDTFYFLNLEKVIIGNKTFELKPMFMSNGKKLDHGNMIIDSGTTLTYLPEGDFYDRLESALKEAIGIESTTDPNGDFKLCYKNKANLNVPYMAMQFPGAKLELPSSSTFLEVDDGLVCFTMVPTSSYVSIFGNLLQENFLISYDLLKNKISFMPTDCSKE